MRIADMPEFRDKSQILMYPETTKVMDAVEAMSEKNYGAILIVDKSEKLKGVFTERDLMRRVVAAGLDPKKTDLKKVMTSNVKTAKISDKVADSLRRMSQGRFRHMPVTDDKGKLQGMLSQGDFVAFTMSDAIFRAGSAASANIAAGNSTPFSIILAVGIYTVVLLFIVAGLGSWLGLH